MELTDHTLRVEYEPSERATTKRDGTPTVVKQGWAVSFPWSGRTLLLDGFSRRKDAEIAARVLFASGLDPKLPVEELRQIWVAGGSRDGFMKKVCEALQW